MKTTHLLFLIFLLLIALILLFALSVKTDYQSLSFIWLAMGLVTPIAAGVVIYSLHQAFYSAYSKSDDGMLERESVSDLKMVDMGGFKQVKGSIGGLIAMGFSSKTVLNKVRIIAHTTDQIFPAFRDSNIIIRNCQLMIYLPGEENDQYLHILEKIREWRELQTNRRIEELEIKTYHQIPQKYIVTFDNDSALVGFYYNDKTKLSGTNYLAPIFTTEPNLTNMFIEMFDLSWNEAVLDDVSEIASGSKFNSD